MKKSLFILLLVFTVCIHFGYSQCAFDPTITGDTLLCPNDTGSLSTQVYDSYQWYKRPFSGTYQIIPGAVNQTLSIDAANDAGYYFRVEATVDTCSEFSPEVLVDGWVFLLPYTIIEGDYTIGPVGELLLCAGDTILLLSSMPYDINLQWYDNGSPIAGANNDTLIVTTSGSYTWSGAPSLCPNYNQTQFIPADVVVIPCSTSVEESANIKIQMQSNLVTDYLELQNASGKNYEILNVMGNVVLTGTLNSKPENYRISIDLLASGTYFIRINGSRTSGTASFIKM